MTRRANIKKYQQMAGNNNFGETSLVYKFKQINITADKINEFWTTPMDKIYNTYVLKEQVIKIEENKSNNR